MFGYIVPILIITASLIVLTVAVWAALAMSAQTEERIEAMRSKTKRGDGLPSNGDHHP